MHLIQGKKIYMKVLITIFFTLAASNVHSQLSMANDNFRYSGPFHPNDSVTVVIDSTSLAKSVLTYDSKNVARREHSIQIKNFYFTFVNYDGAAKVISSSGESGQLSYSLDDMNCLKQFTLFSDSILLELRFEQNGEITHSFSCNFNTCNQCYSRSNINGVIVEEDYLPFRCGGSKTPQIYKEIYQRRGAFPITRRKYYEGELIKNEPIPYSETIK